REVLDIVNVALEKSLEPTQVGFGLEPSLQVRLIGKVLVRHIARIAAVGHFADRVDAEKRYHRSRGIIADLVAGDESLAGHDEFFGSAGKIEVGDTGAAQATVAEAIGLVNVNGGDIGVKGR